MVSTLDKWYQLFEIHISKLSEICAFTLIKLTSRHMYPYVYYKTVANLNVVQCSQYDLVAKSCSPIAQ